MFNFLASQHRELPDIVGPFDEEEDEFPLKSSRLADYISATFDNSLFKLGKKEAG